MRIQYAIFYTLDMKSAVMFYEQVLRLNKLSEDDRFSAFEIGDQRLGIKIREEEREIPGSQTVILEVDDIRDTYHTILEKGLSPYKELSDESWGLNFAILDPDSNKIEFVGFE